jgi:predicted ABC-type transport system involved in lysophospholipase L1 biosynthesis ATPase subunit
MTLLSLEHVSKRHRHGRHEVVILDCVSLEVDPDDFVGIWGAPQAGKSSLLRLAAGIEAPDSGVVRFEGQDLATLSGAQRALLLRRAIGMVSASPHESTTWDAHRGDEIVDYVAVPLLGDGCSRVAADLAATQALERVGIIDSLHESIRELSLGERVRVSLARALVREPRLLLVDEPAMIPSPGERDAIRDLLRSVARQGGVALIVASEDPGLLRGARRVFSVGDGRLLSSDRLGQVLPFPGPDRTEPLDTPP